MTIKYSETELDNMIRYSELYGKMIPGEEVTEMLESMDKHLNNKLEEIESENEESKDKFIEENQDRLDDYHTELSDRIVDVQKNVSGLIELLLENDLPDFVSEYMDKIKNELARIDTDIFYELD